MFTIVSLFSEVILPQKKIQLQSGPERLMLIRPTGSLQIKWEQQERQTSSRDIVLVQDVEITNTTENFVKIKGIVFQTPFTCHLSNGLIDITSDSVSYIQNLLDSVEEIPPHIIPQAESQFNLLCQSLLDLNSKPFDVTPHVDEPFGKIDRRLIIVHRYIRQNYSQPITLQVLADLIKCNPIYLSNTYSKIFKIPPMKYLQIIRMRKAKELLINTKMSIKDITVGLGYVSNSQFSNMFKHYNGCTPVEYRREAWVLLESEAVNQRDNRFEESR